MIFSEPFESTDGTVVITVSRPGWGDRPAHPIGVYTVTSQRTTFTPAVDASRVALIGALTGFAAAVIATFAVLRRPPWPELTEAVMIVMSKEKAALRKA